MRYWALALVLIALITAYAIVKNSSVPRELGVENGRLAPLRDTPNGVSSQAGDDERRVAALPPKEDAKSTASAIKAAAEAYGKHEILVETDTYLHMVFITKTMGFKDDVEFYIDMEGGLVHYRSQSRMGYSDMGLNRSRYEAIAEYYRGH